MTADALVQRARAATQVVVDDLDHPALDDDDAHHLGRVLRVRNGESVVATDGNGSWRMCAWDDGALAVNGATQTEPEPRATAVAFALTKSDKPEWVVQKLTEIGIMHIVPFISAHSVVKWDTEKARKNVDRWRRIAREASMQSRRVWLPVVDEVHPFEAIASAGFALAAPGTTQRASMMSKIAIGPEGGWSDAELHHVPQHITLGDTILRAETAALAAAVAIMNAPVAAR